MKIAICTKTLDNENKNRGAGVYTYNLLKSLKEINDPDTIVLGFKDAIPEEADLVHYPFFDPFFLTLPLVKHKPTIITVHDLSPIVCANHFPRGIRGEIKWQIQKVSLNAASAIVTDSKNSAKDINKITGFSNSKIFPIPLGPSGDYKMITDKTLLAKIKNKYNLPEIFILYVGDVNWNKNTTGLIKAFNRIKKLELRIKNDLKLVLVGKAFLKNNLAEVVEINKLIAELGIDKYVVKPGFIEVEDMAGIYSLARVYVQPSFYEGFGLPVLDAMACGCPVACSNTTSLPEVGGEAVKYFNPDNAGEMAKAIIEILNFDDSIHRSVVNKGYIQASKFSWKKTAKETAEVYKQIASSNSI